LQYRALSTTGMQISEICFGCWQLGATEAYGIREEEALAAVEAAVALGINCFDTADIYSNGVSEERLGRVLRRVPREQVLIATKVGSVPGGLDSSPRHIKRSIDGSLRRLGVAYVDLYQIHWPDRTVPYEESWGAMVDLLQAGKVRAIGVSNYDAGAIRRCLRSGPVHSLQPPYHMFNRAIEGDLLEVCRAHRIAILPYGPQAHGLLSGKYKKGDRPQLPPNDWRRHYSFFRDTFDEHMVAVERLAALAGRLGLTLGQMAIAWTLRLPEVAAAITGPRTAAHVREHAGAAGVRLSAEILAEVETILADLGSAEARPGA
jgi:aryl-alcohol dehydrogenase-like predicted oxidoreductase